MARMHDDQLRAQLDHEIQNSANWQVSTVRDEQERNLAFYLGLPMGNEVEGRSQVQSLDVFEVVESVLPEMLEPFFSGDDIGRFEPSEPNDENFCDQATDYTNYIIKRQNKGFLLFNTWVKDGLLSKIGVVRAEWVKCDPKREEYQGLTDDQIALMMQDSRIQIVERESYLMPGVEVPEVPPGVDPSMVPQPPMLHDVVILRQMPGRVKIENVKPENFIVSRGAESLEASKVVGEIVEYTRSDLIEMGISKQAAADVTSYDIGTGQLETLDDVRNDGEGYLYEDDAVDPALEEVHLFRGFMKVDYNGDGVAEYRRVLVGGNAILENEEADCHNYAVWTPIPVPHRVIGLGYADIAAESQRLKTALTRQFVDSIFLANNPRTYVNMSAQVNIEDMLSNRIGGIIRGTGPAADAISPVKTTLVASESLQAIEFADTQREQRAGVTRYNQGLDADSLNKTATGVQKVMNAAQKRLLMTLRIFAETGATDLFKLVLRLITKYQDVPSTIRLRGEWINFDPRGWNPDMDVTVEVGIGSGDRTETLMMLQQFGQFMAQAAQVGVVGPQQVYEFGKRLIKNAKIRGGEDDLLIDPSKQPPKPPQPNPEVVKIQAQQQIEQAKLQASQQIKQAELAQQAEIERLKAQYQAQVDQAKFQAESDQQQLRIQMEAQLNQMRLNNEMQVQQARMEFERWKAELDASVKIETANISSKAKVENAATTTATEEISREVQP